MFSELDIFAPIKWSDYFTFVDVDMQENHKMICIEPVNGRCYEKKTKNIINQLIDQKPCLSCLCSHYLPCSTIEVLKFISYL